MKKIRLDNTRGNHSSLIPLSEEILYILKKELTKVGREFSFSPGIIIRKNIKVKSPSVKVSLDGGSLYVVVLMKNSKQVLRLYNINREEFIPVLENYCKIKNIKLV